MYVFDYLQIFKLRKNYKGGFLSTGKPVDKNRTFRRPTGKSVENTISSTNISNLIDSAKKFDTTTLMMIGGSIIILFIIFK